MNDDIPNTPPPKTDGSSAGFIDSLLAGSDKWHAVLVSIGAFFAAAANVKLALEAQWAFALSMLVLCLIGFSLYILGNRRHATKMRQARILRVAATAVLASVPVATAAAFFFIAFWPRVTEHGTGPIIAIARFDGPNLPPPYEYCRPSDMLANTLTDITHHYDHLTAFELPYVIDPNGPWAAKWADWHGMLAGADSVVYGEYSFVDDPAREKKPDRLRISPQTDQVPMLPLGPKTAPLLHWDFPDRIVPIDELCAGHAQRFLRDGKRLFLAIVGLKAFAADEFISAERALEDAERTQDETEKLFESSGKPDESRCDRVPAAASQCSGVLAFYLAALEQRLGHYSIAEREYAYAGEKLNRAVPFVDLAELYAQENQGAKALRALQSAESADPTSILVAATRAEYESQFRTTGESAEESQEAAAVELQRAKYLAASRPPNEYERIVLCRAEYLQDPVTGLVCRQNVPRPDYRTFPDAEIEYARWLIATRRPEEVEEGIAGLRDVLREHPNNIKANYILARALAESRMPRDAEVREHYEVAVNARAFSDDEFTDQGNAATELGHYHTAERRYQLALTVNPRFAYAYVNLGRMRKLRGDDIVLACRDFQKARQLHPRDAEVRAAASTIASIPVSWRHECTPRGPKATALRL